MTTKDSLWLVWKVPDEPIPDSPYYDYGVYPTGELMGVCRNEDEADSLIEYLKEFSPSERFGESENPRHNSMEDAPYTFTKSQRDVTTIG